jgi:hypothetical protein
MDFPHVILARLYEHIEPIDRGDRYEDPLQATLEGATIGRVTGGGSQLNELGGIAYADIEIELANLDGALGVVVDALENAGAPQGSELIDLSDSRVLRQFGTQQCLAIFLDGTTLPDEVYADLDFEAVVTELGAAAGVAVVGASGRDRRRQASSSSVRMPKPCSPVSSLFCAGCRSDRMHASYCVTASRN